MTNKKYVERIARIIRKIESSRRLPERLRMIFQLKKKKKGGEAIASVPKDAHKRREDSE